MPTPMTILNSSSEPTMGNTNVPLKKTIQVDLFGHPCTNSTTRVHVTSYRKQNGMVVSNHIRHLKKIPVSKKVVKKKKLNESLKVFRLSTDCKASIALAHSIHIQELQNLMKHS